MSRICDAAPPLTEVTRKTDADDETLDDATEEEDEDRRLCFLDFFDFFDFFLSFRSFLSFFSRLASRSRTSSKGASAIALGANGETLRALFSTREV